MKHKVLGLALCGANLMVAQNVVKGDSIAMGEKLDPISLCDDSLSTQVSSKNIFIPIESLLQKNKGVNLINRGNFAQDPVLRSYKAEQINVTLNGMRMFGACTDRMDPVTSYAETSNLKSISVSHSGNTDLVGNALGGSVHMKLKEAGFSGTPLTSTTIGSSFSTNTSGYNLFGQVDHRNKRWGVYLQASSRDHNNYKAGGGEEIQFSQYQKYNLTANVAYQISKKEVLKVNVLYDNAQDVGYPSLPMDVGLAEATLAGAHYENFLNGKTIRAAEAMLYYNSIYHEMDDTKRPNVPMHMDMPGWSKTAGAWGKIHSQELKGHRLSGMLEYYQNFRRAEMTMYPDNEIPMFMLTWPDIMRITGGLALTDNWQINKKLQLNSSLRMDVNSSYITTDFGKQHLEVFGYDVDGIFNMPVFSWKENLSYQLNKTSAFSVHLAYAERVPSVSEQFGFYLYNANDGYDYIGNPNIKKEQAFQFELGFRQRFEKLSWNIQAYAHHVNNYILGRTDSTLDAMTIGAYGVRTYTNLRFARLMGFEAQANYQILKVLKVSAQAQYTYGEESSGEALPLIAPLQGIIKLEWGKSSWYSHASMNWSATQNRVNTNFGDLPTEGYHLLNLTLGKSWNFGNTRLQTEIKAQNLLDVNYRNHLSWGQVPQIGRNIMVNLVFSI